LARPDLGIAYLAPASQLEGELAAIWCEVLGVSRVGMEDGFFDLGGHSLLLVALQAKIHERLERDVSLVDLLAYPSVRALAAHLAASEAPAAPARREVTRRQEDVLALRARRRRARGAPSGDSGT
jgi:acyl carrier protein